MDINYVFANKNTTDMTDIFGGYSYPKMPKRSKVYKKSQLVSARRNLTPAFVTSNKLEQMKAAIRLGKEVGKNLKNKYNQWRSKRSKTGSRNQVLAKMEMSSHNDMTIHKMANVYLRGKPYRGKTTSTLTHMENYQASNSIGQGYQSVDLLEHIANHPKLIGQAVADRAQANYSVFNPYKLETAGGRINMDSSVYDARPPQMRLLYKSVTATYEFVSLVNIPIVLELLLCTPAFDTAYNPVEVWNNAVSNDAQLYPLEAQGQTSYGASTTQVGRPATNSYGNEPYHHRDFNKQWKILGKKIFILQPGDQRIYKHTININKVISVAQFEKRNNFFKAGYTVVPMVIGRGGAIGLAEGDNADAGQAGHGPVKYGTIVTYKHNFKGMPQSQYNALIMEENLTVAQAALRVKHIDDNDKDATYVDS